jgi:hypothetical protein
MAIRIGVLAMVQSCRRPAACAVYMVALAIPVAGIFAAPTFAANSADDLVGISDGPSIQRAIDSAPGRMIALPQGDYEISQPIVIAHDGGGLNGPGRIIQTRPEQPIVVVSHADDVQIRDLILTRPTGTDGEVSGLVANTCRNLVIDNVQVLDNRAAAGAVNIDKCVNGRLSNCLVRNYTRVSVDDRTANPDGGYAFKCFDGTGIQLTGCRGMLVQGNRIEEMNNRPTRENKEKYGLGKFTKKNATRGAMTTQELWDKEEFPQWHQGSAMYVGGPKDSGQTRVIGNYIENAAQGLDIQSDNVIVSQNIVDNAAVGVKAMHGSRNVLILGNQFNRCNAHGIQLQPGVASHGVVNEEGNGAASTDLPPANIDGGTIVANNILSDFGYGDSHWIWGDERDVIALEGGQKPHSPPLSDVIVQGNVVFDPTTAPSSDLSERQPKPRYRYALMVTADSPASRAPVKLQVFNNVFHPGSWGVSNIDLSKQRP